MGTEVQIAQLLARGGFGLVADRRAGSRIFKNKTLVKSERTLIGNLELLNSLKVVLNVGMTTALS